MTPNLSWPWIFTINDSEDAAILHNGSKQIVDEDHPIVGGEQIRIFCGGINPYGTPDPIDHLVRSIYRAWVWLEGLAVPADFAGAAPGRPKLGQVNIRFPVGLRPGIRTLRIVEGYFASNAVQVPVA